MGCQTAWDNEEHTIMCRTLTTPWSFADITATEPQVYGAIRQNGREIGVMIHFPDCLHLPTDALSKFQKQLKRKPDEVVIIVFVVEETPMANILFGIVERMSFRHNHVVKKTNSLDIARHMILDYLEHRKLRL